MTTNPPLTASRSATTADRFKPGEMFWHFSPVDNVWYRYLVMPQSFSDERNKGLACADVWTICTQTGDENPFVASNNVYADESDAMAAETAKAWDRRGNPAEFRVHCPHCAITWTATDPNYRCECCTGRKPTEAEADAYLSPLTRLFQEQRECKPIFIGPGKGSGVYGPEADFTKALGGATLVEQKDMKL